MQELHLRFNTTSKNPSINITIDGFNVESVISNNEVIIWHNLSHGFHLIEITLINKQGYRPIVFTDASLDGVSFRQTLYTMYSDKETRHQTTTLTESDNVLCLPFINPISHWIASCAEKIPSRLYAKNLYSELAVYYPESVTIPKSFPQGLQDFFKYNLDFYVHPKKLLDDPYYQHRVPYALVDIKYNEAALYTELMANLSHLEKVARSPAQNQYNKFEREQANYWEVVDLILPQQDIALTVEQYPELHKLINSLQLENIMYAFIGILRPGDYVYPHVDQYHDLGDAFSTYGGCRQLYIPVNFKEGNLFKFANIGLVPLDKGPVLVNNDDFAHAVINSSTQNRFAIGVIGSRLSNV